MDFRNVQEGDTLLFTDRRGGETYVETVEFVEISESGHPSVRFADGTRRMVLQSQLSEPSAEGGHAFCVRGFEAIEKVPTAGSKTSARVYVPLSWMGKRVLIIRLEE
jgi:hypothetical protein